MGEAVTPELEMQVQARSELFGTPEVADAAKEFFARIRAYDFYAGMRAKAPDPDAAREAQWEMNEHRDRVSDQVEAVEMMMRDELANL
jgi:hypothetical protein